LREIAESFSAEGQASAISVSVPGISLPAVRDRLMKALGSKLGPAPRAADLADPRAATLSAEANVQEAMAPFLTSALPALSVVTSQGHVVAVVERRAVDRALFHGLFDLPVAQLAVFDPVCAEAEASPEKLAEAAALSQQSVFPVVAGGQRYAGVATRAELFAAASARPAGRRMIHGALVRAEGESMARALARALPAPTVELLSALGRTAAERGAVALLVGGAVRDLLLGRPMADLDVVIEGDAPTIAREFADRVGAGVTVHDEFRTATLRLADRSLDLATARREFYERPAVLPRIEAASWREDRERRDFTINSMLLDLRPDRFGALYDAWSGQDDLHNRRVRILHALSFVEDPTRVFRAARFARRLGFEVEERTERALRTAVQRGFVGRLAGTRVWKELELIFAEERPAPILEWLLRVGAFVGLGLPAEVDPERARILAQTAKLLAWRRKWRPDLDLHGNAVWLAALTSTAPENDRRSFIDRVEAPAGLGERTAAMRAAANEIIEALEAGPERRASQIAATLRARPVEAAFLAAGLAEGDAVRRAVRLYFTDLMSVQPTIGGEDLIALGLSPGPAFREILDRIRDARLDGMVKTRVDELALAKKLAAKPRGGE
jgi:tRNA nucleotidyltransferase (CCA-adding enzyme)